MISKIKWGDSSGTARRGDAMALIADGVIDGVDRTGTPERRRPRLRWWAAWRAAWGPDYCRGLVLSTHP